MNDLTRMAKRVKRLPKKLRRHLDTNIEREMEMMARTARANLVSSRTMASTRLAAQTRHVNYTEQGRFAGFATHAVSAQTSYARFVEYGTGYYSERGYKEPDPVPPLSNILEWIVQKGITPYAYDSIYELAQAIQWTIGMFGNRAHPFMRPAWQQHRGGLTLAHRRGVRRALRSL